MKKILKILRDIYFWLITNAQIILFRLKSENSAPLLITNGMGLSGAPVVLVQAAHVLKEEGYRPIILTEYYGPLIRHCKRDHIRVWVIPKIGKRGLTKAVCGLTYPFVVANTVQNIGWVEKLQKSNIPILWWLHEGKTYLDPWSKFLPRKLSKTTQVASVSTKTVESLKAHHIDYGNELLHYGILDFSEKLNKREKNDNYSFLLIGSICRRKNQISAVKAFLKLRADYDIVVNLVIVGDVLTGEEDYFGDFQKLIANQKNISYSSRVERANIPALYSQIDAVVCSSTDDPLPVVVTEGLMCSKQVIVSEGCGQYELIRDNLDGYKYRLPEKLDETMYRAYRDRNNINVRKNARRLFEREFSAKNFKRTFTKKIKQLETLNNDL